MSNASENWIPRCPRCGESNVVLAPANGYTKYILPMVEVYCTHCQWRDQLDRVIKQVYVRV